MRHTGLIGVGLLGTAIAERLLQAGYAVTGYDANPEQITALEGLGGVRADSAAAVFAACDRVILSLPTSDIVKQVLEQARPALRPGLLIVDTTTGAPEDAEGLAARLAADGVDYVDATVGGSSQVTRDGDAIVLCGGATEAVDRARDLLQQFSRRHFHLGPAGSGARMKLVMNLVLGLNRAVLAEGLEFARAAGVDPATALEVLKTGPAYSRAMDAKGRRMLEEDFEPEARLSQHLKDVRLILAEGAHCGAPLPLSAAHRDLLEAAERAGYGASDNSAVIMAYRRKR